MSVPRARVFALPVVIVSLVAGLVGCGPSPAEGPPDATLYDHDAAAEPERLSQSGLYANTAAGVLADGVELYAPRFELWSDGADKRRWIAVPDGERIDNADADGWVFPEGTRLWKEFSSGGVKLETRLLYKQGPDPGDWYMMSYVWNDDESDADAAPDGAEAVRGTEHAVPSQEDCVDCHEPTHDGALGFSPIQLDRDPAEADGELTLDDLRARGVLRYGTGTDGYPNYPLPGSASEQDVLGYLHGNCAGCHNPGSDVLGGVDTRPLFHIPTDEEARASVDSLPAYESTLGVRTTETRGATYHIDPGNPGDSAVYERMSTRDSDLAMPPLATDVVDEDATAAVRAWIESLEAPGDGDADGAGADGNQ